ncbi:MAG TPA: lysoplasmalogenase family protein [Caldilineaceae bacterium]|nr:lysoplasmalogenase family protein [Caldilineaceae bacterium]
MTLALAAALILTGVAVVCAAMLYRAHRAGANKQLLSFGALAMALILLVALLAPQPVGLFYKAAILLGLIIATLATALLLSRFLPDYAAHAHFLLVYLFYFAAFASRTRFPLPSLAVLLVIVGWAIAYFQFTPVLRDEWGAATAYAVALGISAWQALELVVLQPGALWSWLALAGMALIVAVHSVQAVDRFRRPFQVASLAPVALILAHGAVAWSVWAFPI